MALLCSDLLCACFQTFEKPLNKVGFPLTSWFPAHILCISTRGRMASGGGFRFAHSQAADSDSASDYEDD